MKGGQREDEEGEEAADVAEEEEEGVGVGDTL